MDCFQRSGMRRELPSSTCLAPIADDVLPLFIFSLSFQYAPCVHLFIVFMRFLREAFVTFVEAVQALAPILQAQRYSVSLRTEVPTQPAVAYGCLLMVCSSFLASMLGPIALLPSPSASLPHCHSNAGLSPSSSCLCVLHLCTLLLALRSLRFFVVFRFIVVALRCCAKVHRAVRAWRPGFRDWHPHDCVEDDALQLGAQFDGRHRGTWKACVSISSLASAL